MTSAVVYILACGIRQLKAARGDIEAGWEPESLVHFRAAMDAAFDIGFLLEKSGEERKQLALQYHAMIWLRVKPIQRMMDEDPERFDAERRKHNDLLRDKYRESPALDTRNHWSGKNRSVVLEDAYKFFDSVLPEDAKEVARKLKRIMGDELGSIVTHVDPASHVHIPRDGGWPMIEPTPSEFLFGYGYCLVASLLLSAATERSQDASFKAHCAALLSELKEIMIEADGERGEKTPI